MEIKMLPYDDRNFWKTEGKPTGYDCPLCEHNIPRKEAVSTMSFVKIKITKHIKGNRKQRSAFKFWDRRRWKSVVMTFPVSDWVSIKFLM